jgi:hypothetical protein
MKKQTYLNRTQINALVERSITIYNEKVQAVNALREEENEERKAKYKNKVEMMLHDADCTAQQYRELVKHLCDNNDLYGIEKYKSWSIDALCGKLTQRERSAYDPKGWQKEGHPLHKVLEQMRFELVMAPAADFEKHIAAMVSKINAMFKDAK